MTGPEHYRAAELLLDETAGPWIEDGEQWKVAAAQVHATLALTAATALRTVDGALPQPDYRAWHDAAAAKPQEVTSGPR